MTDNNKHLDEMLDKALAGYSSAEPRSGLENRILVRLDERRTNGFAQSQGTRFRWWPALGLATAAAIAAIIVLSWPRQTSQVAVQTLVQPNVMTPQASQPQIPKVLPTAKAHLHFSAQRVVPSLGPQPVTQLAVVKQEVFPAASGLTPQEQLIFAYLRRTAVSEVVTQSKPDEVVDVFQPPNRVQLSRPSDFNLGR